MRCFELMASGRAGLGAVVELRGEVDAFEVAASPRSVPGLGKSATDLVDVGELAR